MIAAFYLPNQIVTINIINQAKVFGHAGYQF